MNTESWKPLVLPKNNSFKILCLTANYPHKNFQIIPQVIESLLKLGFSDFTFYVSLKEEDLELNEAIKRHICFLNRVDLVQLPSLYQQMDLLFMPSLLEVFSTTYLEAMYMKIPIIASDMPFARDICGECAMYASPLSGKDYAKLIIDLYNNISLRKELISKGEKNLKRFGSSLDRTKKYLEILERYGNTK
ncbi:glycosyltransferase [Sphingobacterium sp. E70]|uniref:glycosyltransferase n=1 Tax=Sphingobacterium sp. E70 TaxID=2853439 RepID=UPI00211CBAF6|nr:glycosyltransferase [Sphingobacterium sp. E70]ULT28251.1 glycosyltransferase [Sphingobacterium sp. E70]